MLQPKIPLDGFDFPNNPAYMEYPFLEKYVDILGNLNSSSIISDIWTQALIVKPEKLMGVVAKIERPNAIDKVIVEYYLHNKAYTIWETGKDRGLIPENVYIPKISIPSWVDTWFVLIEQILWQSLHTKALIDNAYKSIQYAHPLSQIEKEEVYHLSDGDAKRYIMKKYGLILLIFQSFLR